VDEMNFRTKTEQPQCLRAAIWYGRKGWSVLPLNGKTPILPGWPDKAVTDPQTIESWWTENPTANVGILTGIRSGLVVIDIDPRNGGEESFDSLVEELGPLPATPEVLTGGGGRHIYLRYPSGGTIPKSKPRRGLDVQSNKSLVVAPPSRHPETGRSYVWEESSRPDHLPLGDLPEKWLNFLSEKQEVHRSATSSSEWKNLVLNGVAAGSRNEAVARLAGHLLAKKVDPYVTLELILVWNESRNRPPLPDEEVIKTVDSIAKAELRKIGGRRRG
nr:bifunctional DNA primase/polymerase [Nitrospiraceae bacterium]